VRVRESARERWLEENPRFGRSDLDVFQVSYQQAAMLVLMARGCTQTPESLGVTPMLQHLEDSLNVIRQSLEDLESQYIAPEGCELHQYNVKRPSRPELRRRNIPEDLIPLHQREFWYAKLSSKEPLFRPQWEQHFNSKTGEWERNELVESLHVGREGNPRNAEAHKGVQRRNTLLRLRSLLTNAESLLREAATLSMNELPENLPPVMVQEQDGDIHVLSAGEFWDGANWGKTSEAVTRGNLA
jgi:hypothetical protein